MSNHYTDSFDAERTEQATRAIIDEALAAYDPVDDIDIDALADAVADRLDTDNDNELTEADVIELIEKHADGSVDVDYDELAKGVLERIKQGYGNGDYGERYGGNPFESGISEDRVREIISEEGGAGNINEDQVREIVNDELEPIRTELEDLIEEVRNVKDGIGDLIGDPIGPEFTSTAGAYHSVSYWGVHFETDVPRRFGSAKVDAGEEGTFTAVLARYDGDERYDVHESTEVTVQEGENDITLGFDVPAGEWLLTRPSEFPLRRFEWDGWGEIDGLELIGGSKPGDFSKPNPYWYYFQSINQHTTAGADALFGPTQPPAISEETEYSTSGRGVHFSSDTEFSIGKARYRANRSGTFYAELHEYRNGTSQGVVDSTEVHVPTGDDVHTIDLDLSAGPGEYLLCRDYQAEQEGFDIQEDGVALALQVDYQYFDHDSRDWLTVYGSAHPEFSSTGDWYNWYSVHVHKED